MVIEFEQSSESSRKSPILASAGRWNSETGIKTQHKRVALEAKWVFLPYCKPHNLVISYSYLYLFGYNSVIPCI